MDCQLWSVVKYLNFLKIKLSLNLIAISQVSSVADTEVFTIETKGCTIPNFPFVTEEISKFVGPPLIKHTCSENNRLVDSNNTHIWIIDDALDLFNIRFEKEFYCCYRNFSSESNIESIKYGECIQFSTTIQAKHEFVRVECFYIDDKMYDDFFVFTNIPNNSPRINDNMYNILILGIESMSRMNFHRTMKNTQEYLDLKGAIELQGYNKLGDNSFPNLFPLLFGHSFEYVKETCFKKNTLDTDVCSFIWKTFKDSGYYTALGSDSIAGFLDEYEYNLTRAPTDFYLQPFMFETRHLFTNKHYNYHQCLGSRYAYKVMLDYVAGIMSNLKHSKLFGIFWEESISHEDLNYPYIMDMDYLNLILYLEENGHLNDTVLIFLSDHGMRWGNIVQTEQGRLEERLPLLKVLFPETFKLHYRHAFKNFLDNRHRLTTPYDIHESLTHLANPSLLEDAQINKRSLAHNSLNKSSLFLPVSDTRTCKSVGIQNHWCTCYKGKKLKVKNKNREKVARFLISHINTLLNPYHRCVKLKVLRVLQVTMVQSGKERIYTAVVETTPGGGILDGTILNERGQWIVSGTVSRLNLYRNHTCIDDSIVRMYCFCK